MKLITLTSDFEKQSQGVGAMEAVAYEICPEAKVVHLMHGLPDFDIVMGARTIETVVFIPVGNHVCVVDPGVGTQRRGIIIQTKRGDYLIGPDNGVLIPAARRLGIKKSVEITNRKYMHEPVSPIFHGRDVFTPAAAHLAKGVRIEEFGKEIPIENLVKAPYDEAEVRDGKIEAEVINVNKFGSCHLNITHAVFDALGLKNGKTCTIQLKNKKVILPVATTFGDVPSGKELILKDDYGRVELAINQGRFIDKYGIQIKDKIIVSK